MLAPLTAAIAVALAATADCSGVTAATVAQVVTPRGLVPVVATAVDGTPEIVDDPATGLLVQPHDAEGLAHALARVLDDPVLAAQMGAEALRRSEADYTWAANARRMEDVYAAVVQG